MTALVGASVVVPTAHADRRLSLPAERQQHRMGDGTVVVFQRVRERATINASVGGTPLHRNAWVSGKFAVRTSRVVDNIEIVPGYVVGCQINIGGASGDGGVGYDADAFGAAAYGGTLTLGPGQARRYYLIDSENADPFGQERHEVKIRYKNAKRGTLSYANSQLSLRGCAGYAQARSFANITIETEFATQTMSFYGRPFSLG
ncbi:hypothetical protein HLA97_06950 [Gordonia araii NBRC 100433]|nr:MspA family porin [Gordonia araii]NNG96985.1 hypothetical protein [Gordonia araii NBRC 100433]